MTGFPGWNQENFQLGWYEDITEGLATLYISIIDEGIVTLSTDTPSSKSFRARIQNPENWSIARAPIVWVDGDTSVQMASVSTMRLEDEDGLYAFLVGADLRDAEVVVQWVAARDFGTATMMADAPVVATIVLDAVTKSASYVELSFKDTLSRLDRALPVRYNPPFVDSGAANRMVPISLGAVRNVAPLPIDKANRIYQMSDAPMSNVSAIRDGGAPLDPNADIPQYQPALSGSGFQLETDPVDKLTYDASSVGAQVVIPGADDLLDGIGDFATWDGGGVPVGWDFSNNAGSLLLQRGFAQGFPYDHMAMLLSSRTWYPPNGQYGDQLVTETNWLEANTAYRLTIRIFSTFAPLVSGDAQNGGVQVRSALSNLAADAISPHGLPLTIPQAGGQTYVFEFRVPPGSDRPIYVISSTSRQGVTPVGQGGGIIQSVALQRLGEYIELPLTGIDLGGFMVEWLLVRAGESANIYNTSDINTIDLSTGYKIGYHVTEQPNILDGVRTALDNWCATTWTDHIGVMRFGRLTDPKDGTPIAAFDETNTARDITITAYAAEHLTTVIGTTRNWDPLADADFVTDFDIVPEDVRTRYKRVSQFQRTSSKTPAGQYAFAIGAPVFDSLLDDPVDGQTEIDRVDGFFSPRVYDDATTTTGKRKKVTWTAYFDELDELGVGTQCDVRDIMYGVVVTLNRPDVGIDNASVMITEWEPFFFGQRIQLTGIF